MYADGFFCNQWQTFSNAFLSGLWIICTLRQAVVVMKNVLNVGKSGKVNNSIIFISVLALAGALSQAVDALFWFVWCEDATWLSCLSTIYFFSLTVDIVCAGVALPRVNFCNGDVANRGIVIALTSLIVNYSVDQVLSVLVHDNPQWFPEIDSETKLYIVLFQLFVNWAFLFYIALRFKINSEKLKSLFGLIDLDTVDSPACIIASAEHSRVSFEIILMYANWFVLVARSKYIVGWLWTHYDITFVNGLIWLDVFWALFTGALSFWAHTKFVNNQQFLTAKTCSDVKMESIEAVTLLK